MKMHLGDRARRRPRSTKLAGTIAALGILLLAVAASPAQAATSSWMQPKYPTVDVTSNLVYGTATAGGRQVTLTLDVYRARELAGVARPAVVWVHGGGFFTGDKAAPADAQLASILASRGFVVVSVNYRLRPDFAPFGPAMAPAAEDARQDVQQALRWIRTRFRDFDIDPFRIGIAGASAGAITALDVSYAPSLDWMTSTQSVVSVSGAGLLDLKTRPWSPKALMLNGTDDALVPIDSARSTCAQLNRGHKRCTANEFPTDHGLTGYEIQVIDSTVDHLVNTLQLDQMIAFNQWLRSVRGARFW